MARMKPSPGIETEAVCKAGRTGCSAASGAALLLFGRFDQLQVSKGQVGGGVVALQAEVAWLQPLAFTWVVVGGTVVRPVHDLHAIDPCGNMRAVRDQHRSEPLAVAGNHSAG